MARNTPCPILLPILLLLLDPHQTLAQCAPGESASDLRAARLANAQQWRLTCVHLNVDDLDEFYASLDEVCVEEMAEDVFETGVWSPLDDVKEYNLLSNPLYNGGLIEWLSIEFTNVRWNDTAHSLSWDLDERFRFPNEDPDRVFRDRSGRETVTFEECGARIVRSELKLPDEISVYSRDHPTEPRDLCDIAAVVCPDSFFPYDSVADCVAFLEALPAFCGGATLMGNTSQCRNLHAVNALLNPVTHCPHLAPDSVVCQQDECPAAREEFIAWPDPLSPQAPAEERSAAVAVAAVVVLGAAAAFVALRVRVWLLERRLGAERRRRAAEGDRERSVFRPWGIPMYRFVFAFVDYAHESGPASHLHSIAPPSRTSSKQSSSSLAARFGKGDGSGGDAADDDDGPGFGGSLSRSNSSPSLSSRTASRSSSRRTTPRGGGTSEERRRARERERQRREDAAMAEAAEYARETAAAEEAADEAADSAPADRPSRPLILRNVCGMFNPGELVAIMGPSGSGKTTLLRLLARRRKFGTLKGINLMVDASQLSASTYDPGRLVFPNDRWFRKHVAFVPQEDSSLRPGLTVRQTLEYYSLLKLPPSMTLEERMDRVEEIMEEMGLAGCADRLVGVERGISGGQRRRLTTAVELLTRPSAVFLDECTSGLDATSALDLVRTLSRLASRGRTIVLSIHQPREDIFKLFDTVLLLSSRGSTAYAGPPGKVVQHLQSVVARHRHLVHQLKASNPADFIMDVLSRDELQADVARSYRRSRTRRRIEKEAAELYQLQRRERRRRQRHLDPDGNVFRELLTRGGGGGGRGAKHHLESSHDLHKMSRSGRDVVEVRVPVRVPADAAAGEQGGGGDAEADGETATDYVDSGGEVEAEAEGVHSEPGSPYGSRDDLARVATGASSSSASALEDAVAAAAAGAADGDGESPPNTPRGREGVDEAQRRRRRRERDRQFAVPFLDVLSVQMARFLRRTPAGTLYSLPAGAALMSAVLLTMYWDLGKASQQDMLYRVFVLFVGLLTLFYTSMFQLTGIFVPFEKAAFRHDWESGVAGLLHFHAHQALRDAWVIIVAVAVFYTPLYFGVGLRASDGRFFLSALLVALIALSMQAFVSLLFVLAEPVTATLVSGVYIGVQVLFAGVLRKTDDLPASWGWAPAVTPLYYALGSLLHVEMRGMEMDCAPLDVSALCSTGDEMLRTLGYADVSVATSLWVLTFVYLALRALAVAVSWAQSRRLVLLRLKPDMHRVARALNSGESLRRPRRELVSNVAEASAYARSDGRQRAMQFLSHQREKDESWEETVRKMATLRWKLLKNNLEMVKTSMSRVGTPTSPISPLSPLSPATSLSPRSRSDRSPSPSRDGYLDTGRVRHRRRRGYESSSDQEEDSADDDPEYSEEVDASELSDDDSEARADLGALVRDNSGYGLHSARRRSAPPEMDEETDMSDPRPMHPRGKWPSHRHHDSVDTAELAEHVSVVDDDDDDDDEDEEEEDSSESSSGSDLGRGRPRAIRLRKIKKSAGQGKGKKAAARGKGKGKGKGGAAATAKKQKKKTTTSKATKAVRGKKVVSSAGKKKKAAKSGGGGAAAAAGKKKGKSSRATRSTRPAAVAAAAAAARAPPKRARSQPPQRGFRAARGDWDDVDEPRSGGGGAHRARDRNESLSADHTPTRLSRATALAGARGGPGAARRKSRSATNLRKRPAQSGHL